MLTILWSMTPIVLVQDYVIYGLLNNDTAHFFIYMHIFKQYKSHHIAMGHYLSMAHLSNSPLATRTLSNQIIWTILF